MTSGYDFEGLKRQLLSQSRSLVAAWLPGGKVRGSEYICGNLHGEPGESLKVNLDSGMWSDFATGHKGGDLISLYAAIHSLSQSESYQQLQKYQPIDIVPAPVKPKPVDDFIPIPAGTAIPTIHSKFGATTASYRYTNLNGETLFYVCRFEPPNERKQFLPYSYSKQKGLINKAYPAPRPVYNLEELLKRPNDRVLIVEGEKTAEAARSFNSPYVVTTWSGGSSAFSKTDWSPLRDRKVLIWPDADKPGIAAAKGIVKILEPQCDEIKTIDTQGMPEGWDAADALAADWDWNRVLVWAKNRAVTHAKTAAPPAHLLDVPPPEEAPPDAKPTLEQLYDQLGVARNNHGVPYTNVDNVLRILEGEPRFKNLVWFDEFHQRYFTKWESESVREWRDIDDISLTVHFQRHLGFPRMTVFAVNQAVMKFAINNIRNEPKDWLDTLTWDQVPRLSNFLHDCFGAADNEYTRAVSKNWWIAMIARILSPGCKVDNMVILEGGQGKFKSSALGIIGGPWFTEANESVTSKDFYMVLQGKLLVEISELDAFSKAEVNTIKKVISCQTDRYRMPYARAPQDFPRRSIFVGTTNEDEYLKDPTGARRFWPVRTGNIDLEKIREQRSQLFAEARDLYLAKHTWYEVPIDLAREEQDQRRDHDEWEHAVISYLHNRSGYVFLSDIAKEALNIELDRFDKSVQMRLARIIRRLGWARSQERILGANTKVWRRKNIEESVAH